ncbi:MAG: ATP-binding protein, partial [Chitinophagaceae bacterium]
SLFSNLHFMELPIHHLTTQKRWADIVLNASTLEQIDLLRGWLKQHTEIHSSKNRIPEGYRVLFYGPAGTGKSLTAAILSNELGAEIYQIDLSKLVSKYIGETEKNLNLLFEKAEKNGWVLFFDEADALFGKRTEVKDSHDRYANQEISYLLQKIEDYNGLVIIASNFKNNIDDAFIRRFQSIVHFPLPAAPERRRIWEAGFVEKKLEQPKIDLDSLAEKYELSPASIMNVIRYVNNATQSQNTPAITADLVTKGIQNEYSLKAKKDN